MVFSLNAGRLDLKEVSGETNQWAHFGICGETKGVKSGSLSVFLAMVRKFAELMCGKERNPFEYADIEGQAWSKGFFIFGKGECTSDATSHPT